MTISGIFGMGGGMVYDKPHAPKVIHDMQRWCNNRFIFPKCPRFEDYGKVVEVKDDRQLTLW